MITLRCLSPRGDHAAEALGPDGQYELLSVGVEVRTSGRQRDGGYIREFHQEHVRRMPAMEGYRRPGNPGSKQCQRFTAEVDLAPATVISDRCQWPGLRSRYWQQAIDRATLQVCDVLTVAVTVSAAPVALDQPVQLLPRWRRGRRPRRGTTRRRQAGDSGPNAKADGRQRASQSCLTSVSRSSLAPPEDFNDHAAEETGSHHSWPAWPHCRSAQGTCRSQRTSSGRSPWSYA
jgi:hypothetical protein